jgi:hypothetical protein
VYHIILLHAADVVILTMQGNLQLLAFRVFFLMIFLYGLREFQDLRNPKEPEARASG